MRAAWLLVAAGLAGIPAAWAAEPRAPLSRVQAAAAPRILVAYVATLPARGIGIFGPSADRLAAHGGALTACLDAARESCRFLAETQDRCLAVAHAIRRQGLVLTENPSTYSVHAYDQGSGADEAAAREDALAICGNRRIPGTSCRIAAIRCG